MKERRRILIAPLDWGLGHVARCIPIIRYLLETGNEVIIAADGRALDFAKAEFPQVECIRLQGYSPEYPSGNNMVTKMAMQVPKFTRAIIKEHFEVNQIIDRHKIDAVISDNRYGLWTNKVPCAIINHQLKVIMPWYFKGMQPFVNSLNYHFISRFDECWVPDFNASGNISGTLSYISKKAKNIIHIGLLSRFEKKQVINADNDLLVLLSGPEPQRSILERIILKQLHGSGIKTLIVQGITERKEEKQIDDYVDIVSYLDSSELNDVVQKSKMIIARAGYSTIMDLLALEKSAILIPTPGQTEQEYLAKELMKRGYFFSQKQSSFNLHQALKASENYQIPGNFFNERDAYKKVISDFLSKL